MNKDDSNAAFEAALAATHILVDGTSIDPRTMGVRLSEEHGLKTLPFEMRIGSVLLANELEQAGVELGTTTLEDFVRMDVQDHGETAIQGYLGIVQSVRTPRVKRGFMGLFGERPTMPSVSFWIRRIERIYVEKESLVIAGEAEMSS